jgi:hypothetical protein
MDHADRWVMPDGLQPKRCRNCGSILEKRQHTKPPREKKGRIGGGYYFLYWYRCPACRRTYLEESARRHFHPELQKLRDTALRDGLVKEGIRPVDSVTEEAHSRIIDFVANPANTRKINRWENRFLVSLLRFRTLSHKQMDTLERILGHMSWARVPFEIRNASPVEHPRDLPLHLEAKKNEKTG